MPTTQVLEARNKEVNLQNGLECNAQSTVVPTVMSKAIFLRPACNTADHVAGIHNTTKNIMQNAMIVNKQGVFFHL